MLAKFERFSPPLLNKNIIRRQSVIQQINDLSKRSILFIHAPAGYGKTTTVALWSKDKNVVWFSLDEYSTATNDIYRWLLFALSCEIPNEFDRTPLESTLDVLQKSTNWPDAIIIDDFHLCSDPSVTRALPLIQARMPITTSFIILSRNPPPDILEEHIVKGKIKQITNLQFTSDEIVLLFNKNKMPISKYDAELLHKHTDGWAAALAAILMSNTDNFSEISNRNTLNHYLKSHVFDYQKNFDILKKCSICEELNPEMCETITGQTDAWNVIASLSNKTGLVCRFDNNIYRFHELLKGFLFSELQLDETIDKPLLYRTLAKWYKDNGNILRGIVLAAKSGDTPLIEDYLRLRAREYGKYDADIAGYNSLIMENVYPRVPDFIAKQSLCLSLAYFSAFFCFGRLQEALEWLDIAKGLLTACENDKTDIIRAAYHCAIDPREKVWDIPTIFKNIIPLLTAGQSINHPNTCTLTLNMPLYHKSVVDHSDISPRLDEFISKEKEYMVMVMGPHVMPIILLCEAGVRYERGELSKAEKIAAEAVQISDHFSPEIQFSSMSLYIEILRVQGKTFDLARIDNMINKTKSYYLSSNFNAFMNDLHLLNGKIAAAHAWLAQTEVESVLRLYKIYQYFTTARALIVTRRLSEAEKLLERLATFSLDYQRSSDFIKALTLQSICKWHMKRTDDAIKTIIPAIVKAAKLQIVMPVIMEGHDVSPILKRVVNRLKYGYDTNILDKAFVNTLFLKARAMSQYSQGMFASSNVKPVKFSLRQKEILVYLSQSLSYREISEKTGVKVATVNDHIRKIYEKLGVSNAHDAVAKANELGIEL